MFKHNNLYTYKFIFICNYIYYMYIYNDISYYIVNEADGFVIGLRFAVTM